MACSDRKNHLIQVSIILDQIHQFQSKLYFAKGVNFKNSFQFVSIHLLKIRVTPQV